MRRAALTPEQLSKANFYFQLALNAPTITLPMAIREFDRLHGGNPFVMNLYNSKEEHTLSTLVENENDLVRLFDDLYVGRVQGDTMVTTPVPAFL